MRKYIYFSLIIITSLCKKPGRTSEVKKREYEPYLAIVTDRSGLVLRKEPSSLSEQKALIAFGETIEIHGDADIKETINDVEAFWVETAYKGSEGYVFPGFIKKYSELTNFLETPTTENVSGVWHGHWRTDKLITKLIVKPDHTFELTMFLAADEKGNGGGEMLTGTWQITANLLMLTDNIGGESISYSLYQGRLVIASDTPLRWGHSFRENYGGDYIGGLYR